MGGGAVPCLVADASADGFESVLPISGNADSGDSDLLAGGHPGFWHGGADRDLRDHDVAGRQSEMVAPGDHHSAGHQGHERRPIRI